MDDDDEIHKITRINLRNLKFDGNDVDLVDTYSMQETIKYLSFNKDVAVVLLDVVMESDDAGLNIVKYIRETMNNDQTRIILRTGSRE